MAEMAPSGNYPVNDFKADDLKKIPLPTTLPCQECNKNKHPELFAKKHHSDYRFKKNGDRYFVPTTRNTKYKCKKCTGAQVHELKCEGPCGLWKPLDEFSKSTRTKGEYWCKDCVLWKTSLEPGAEVVAAPGHDLAPDEDGNIVGGDQVVEPEEEGLFDLEEGPGGDDELNEFSDPLTKGGWNTIWTNDFETATSAIGGLSINHNVPTPSVMSGEYVPPHLRGINSASAVSSNAPSLNRSAGPPKMTPAAQDSDRYLPPHMRGMPGSSVRGGDMRSTSSASNPYEDRSSTVSSPNTVVGHPIAFSGWDNTGKQHQQVRLPSGTTSATPPSAPPTATAASVPAEHSTVRGKGNWARPTGNKGIGHGKIYVPPTKTDPANSRRSAGYDSDGSDDYA